ncbi:MAG: sel1 repeat family protein [Gammaproteobacteria bacterium]|nr:sel1 repeat family protein [Gammaproteobacteria bacterium]
MNRSRGSRLWPALLLLTVSVAAAAGEVEADTLASLRPLAEQGDARAQYRLAGMYSAGNGVAADAVEGLLWNGRAAQQGLAEAQFDQGLHYRAGRLFPVDLVRAYMWLSLAEARDHPLARPVMNSVAQRMSEDELAEAQRLVTVWEQTLGLESTCVEPRVR